MSLSDKLKLRVNKLRRIEDNAASVKQQRNQELSDSELYKVLTNVSNVEAFVSQCDDEAKDKILQLLIKKVVK